MDRKKFQPLKVCKKNQLYIILGIDAERSFFQKNITRLLEKHMSLELTGTKQGDKLRAIESEVKPHFACINGPYYDN